MPAAYPIASDRAAVAGRQLVILLLAAILLDGCARARPPRVTPAEAEPGRGRPIKVRVRVDERGAQPGVRTMALEDYVAGCLDAELGRLDIDAAAAVRMRRVQAVLCRTYAIASLGRHEQEGFDLCSTTHCQLYRHLPAESLTARLAQQAASDTAGLVLVHGGKPIKALYHADCGGRTSAADVIWGGQAAPYLTSVADPICEATAGWRSVIDREQLRRALAGDPQTDPGSRLDRVMVASRDEAGRAISVGISGSATRAVRGETFRTVVTRALGAQALRSTRFTVRRDGNEFVFEGRGSGHGAGLCQAGAIRQARAGRSEAAILAYYFPGTQLVSWTDPRPPTLNP